MIPTAHAGAFNNASYKKSNTNKLLK